MTEPLTGEPTCHVCGLVAVQEIAGKRFEITPRNWRICPRCGVWLCSRNRCTKIHDPQCALRSSQARVEALP